MIKLLEFTPERVLRELPKSICIDDNGVVNLLMDDTSDAKWKMLAQNTIYLYHYKKNYGYGDMMFIDIEFSIDDLKQYCPSLYRKIKANDTKNKI
jgi:hypothetical protein